MANSMFSVPLHEKIHRKNTTSRVIDIIILFLLLSLISYRILSLNNHGFVWVAALLCESWFTFVWILTVNIKWNQVDYKTYPDRLLQWAPELPSVDMFITTADPVLEPPILTVNTVLSLLTMDYPPHKLACYVSDDGGSPLIYYSLLEATKFAKLWIPFCKKYNVQLRAPFRYFSLKPLWSHDASMEFQEEWQKMKEEYEQLCQKIEVASQSPLPCVDLTGEFAVFSNIEGRDHPTIVKVIWENKEALSFGLPHLVYISREKRPKYPHHFKAGAMNVLVSSLLFIKFSTIKAYKAIAKAESPLAMTRVSGVMTNAPFMLNVDCDMYAHNPQIVLHAMCMLLGAKNKSEIAYVQCPQYFYDGLKDDPFGNQLVVLNKFVFHGMDGIQGPFYIGSGCFHRRKVIYGLSPDDNEINVKLSDEELRRKFGNSKVLAKSTAQILSGTNGETHKPHDLASSLETANHVANCGYEYGTSWGAKIGWRYGSTAEDGLTGLTIQGKGWRSVCCSPEPPAFLGCVPRGGPASMTQHKRWATGLLEILSGPTNPITLTLKGKLQFRQCMAYMWILVWALRSIPELCYAVLPAYCIITNSQFLPKVQEPAILIPTALFIIYNLYTLSEYFQTGLSIRAWWNNQRMSRVISTNAWLLGALSVVLKLLGLSETVFEITQKDQTSSNGDNGANIGRFTFDESPVFMPGTFILLVNLTALVIGVLKFWPVSGGGGSRSGSGAEVGEFMCSVWVVICFWAFLKGLFGKGKYGIPTYTICKSGAITLLFMHFCKWASMDSGL